MRRTPRGGMADTASAASRSSAPHSGRTSELHLGSRRESQLRARSRAPGSSPAGARGRSRNWRDGWSPEVRIDKKRVRVPVWMTLGRRQNGERVVLDLRIAGDESSAAWGEVIAGSLPIGWRASAISSILDQCLRYRYIARPGATRAGSSTHVRWFAFAARPRSARHRSRGRAGFLRYARPAMAQC